LAIKGTVGGIGTKGVVRLWARDMIGKARELRLNGQERHAEHSRIAANWSQAHSEEPFEWVLEKDLNADLPLDIQRAAGFTLSGAMGQNISNASSKTSRRSALHSSTAAVSNLRSPRTARSWCPWTTTP